MLPMTAGAARHAQRHGGASNECTTKVNHTRCCPTSTTTPWCPALANTTFNNFGILRFLDRFFLLVRSLEASLSFLMRKKCKLQIVLARALRSKCCASRLGTLGSVPEAFGAPAVFGLAHLAVCLKRLERLPFLPQIAVRAFGAPAGFTSDPPPVAAQACVQVLCVRTWQCAWNVWSSCRRTPRLGDQPTASWQVPALHHRPGQQPAWQVLALHLRPGQQPV